MAREDYKIEIYNMALAKMNKVVVVTGDVKMHFRAEEVGDAGLSWKNVLTGLRMS